LLQVLLHCSGQVAGPAAIVTAPGVALAAAVRLLLLLAGCRCCKAPAGKPASALAGPARQKKQTHKQQEWQLSCTVQLIPSVMRHGKDVSQLHLQLFQHVQRFM
jgi:hypothetical protein